MKSYKPRNIRVSPIASAKSVPVIHGRDRELRVI